LTNGSDDQKDVGIGKERWVKLTEPKMNDKRIGVEEGVNRNMEMKRMNSEMTWKT